MNLVYAALLTALIVLTHLLAYVKGFDAGSGKVKWCNRCKIYHNNRELCQPWFLRR